MFAALLISAMTAGVAPAASVAAAESAPVRIDLASVCSSKNAAEIVVCSRPNDRYRIDPSVMEATRAREALPPEGDPRADKALAGATCIGPTECQGDFLPLVAIGLTSLKAATLAAKGEDWREAFRTREDEYRLYKKAQERRARERRVRVLGVVVGN